MSFQALEFVKLKFLNIDAIEEGFNESQTKALNVIIERNKNL